MKSPFIAISIWLTVASIVSCGKSDIDSVPDLNQIENVQWRLTAFDTLGGGTLNLELADTVFLFFGETRVARGRSYGLCRNYYEGVYILAGGNLVRFDSLRSTEAACSSSRYWDYFNQLGKVNSYQLKGSWLYLYYDGNTHSLVFDKAD